MIFDNLKGFFSSRTKPSLPSSKPPEPALPMGLTRDQLEQIQALSESPAYKHYLFTLERLYQNNLGAILRALPHEAYMFQCGVCFALEQVAKLPADLIAKTKELDARHTAAAPEPDAASTFVNTPFWDAYQRLGKRARQYSSAGVPAQHE